MCVCVCVCVYVCVCVCVCVCVSVCVCVLIQNPPSGVLSASKTSTPGSLCIAGSVFRGPALNSLKRLVKPYGGCLTKIWKRPRKTGFIPPAFISVLRKCVFCAKQRTSGDHLNVVAFVHNK